MNQAIDSIVKAEGDTIPVSSSEPQSSDSVRFVREKVDLDHIVEFNAKDSIILFGRNHAVMYGGSKIQ